jgi:predicted O-methyltransferase YrrM
MTTASQPPPAASTADAFDQSHRGRMRSAAVEAIYRSAFGEDYPAPARPSAFYSAATLQAVINALDLRPGRVLADLGCGHGGPGLWAAQQTGATLIGIDLSPAGIELARHRAAQLGLQARASFAAGDLTATGLPDASVDAVMSMDVLPFVPAKAAAVREVARILRPGAGSPSPHGNSSPTQPPAMTTPSARRSRPHSAATPYCNPPRSTTASSPSKPGSPSRHTTNRPAGGTSSKRSPKASSPPNQTSPATWATTTQPWPASSSPTCPMSATSSPSHTARHIHPDSIRPRQAPAGTTGHRRNCHLSVPGTAATSTSAS